MNARLTALVALLCAFCTQAYAQDEISKTPVTDEATLNKTLFDMDTLDVNYYFRANLPDNNFLTVEYKRIGYWPEKGFMKEVFNTARKVAANVADSFRKPGASKRIDINIPINNEPLSIRLVENTMAGNMIVMDNNGSQPLKTGMDTIRIIKTFAKIKKKKYESLVQVQYTFILKDLEQINALDNEQLIDSVETTFSNLVEKKKDNWMFPNAWYNGVDAVYDPYNAKAKKDLVTEGRGGMLRGFDADFNIGVSLFRNELAPNFSLGLTYKWLRRNKDYMYVGTSLSTLGLFDRVGNKVNIYDLNFINGEVGVMFNKPHTLLPLYHTAIGYRILLRDQYTHPTVPGGGTSFYAKYSLSKSTSIALDLYNLDPDEVSLGLTVYFKIL